MVGEFFVDAMGRIVQVTFGPEAGSSLRSQVYQAWSGAFSEESVPDAVVEAPVMDTDERVLEALSSGVTLALLAKNKGTFLTFHAAGLALEDGRVVAMVGPSGRGKTTVSRTLGKNYGYVSDETIAVDASGRVYPYRKPLSVVQKGGPKRQVSPSEAGLRELPEKPLRLTGLVLLNRDPDAPGLSVDMVPLIEAMTGLLSEMSYMTSFDDPLTRLASLCESVGGVRRLTYSDVSQLEGVVEELALPGTFTESWSRVHRMEKPPADLELGDVLDAIECDDQIIVILEQSVRVLAGIAPAVWQAVRRGLSRDEITTFVVECFGDPGEASADELVGKAIGELIDAGLLRPTA